MSSCFSTVTQGPPIEVFSVNKAFLEDLFPQKVNLSIGGNNSVLLLDLYFTNQILIRFFMFIYLCWLVKFQRIIIKNDSDLIGVMNFTFSSVLCSAE